MARRKYIKGALVEARNSKYGKGFGIIVSDREWKYTNAHGYYKQEKQEWFKVYWFKNPGNLGSFYLSRHPDGIDMTKNQIKIVGAR
tara:strand:- start:1612 stop:1869 length:258 start_codon:yes stop_codon:yes gene_type:complete